MSRGLDPSEVLLAALREPESMAGLTPAEWDLLLRQARRCRLHGRLACAAHERALSDGLPEKPRGHFAAARALAADHTRTLRWEIDRVGRALAGLDVPVILLKGAAYVAAELPLARGRLVSDIDIMVPKAMLAVAEQALTAHGWQTMKSGVYDQRYYRDWMHELPPMRHRERRTVLDVHHTILPETSRLHPDPRKLGQAARPLSMPGFQLPGFHVLGPADMVLHSAAHLFHDGDLTLALRDLVDLDDLLRGFADTADFWQGLVLRAQEMDLARPLYYALRYATRLLATPVPLEVIDAAGAAAAPPAAVLALMDRAVPRALLPDHPDRPRRWTASAAMLLYIRSHWLHMPPRLLATHLLRKSVTRLLTPAPHAAAG